jgi:hypothetical protein
MNNQKEGKGKLETQNGDPGRTPGAAEGDLETVEADLREKNLDDANESGKSKNKNVADSALEASK